MVSGKTPQKDAFQSGFIPDAACVRKARSRAPKGVPVTHVRNQNPDLIEPIARAVKKALPHAFPAPAVALVSGTGLGGIADLLDSPFALPYTNLPGFPRSTVESHAGRFLFGSINAMPVVIQQGRCHLYEGYSPAEVCCGVRVMYLLGARTLIVTNAAGALVPHWNAGDLMLIADHINWTGQSPLTGPNHEGWGPRFPSMAQPYDRELQEISLRVAARLGLRLEHGVYLALNGPQMETPAETRIYRSLGAHAVGMSTALEVIAARHMGMRVLGLSCLTNKNLPDCMTDAPLEEIIRVANASGAALARLIEEIVKELIASH